MTPNPIRKVLFTLTRHDVKYLLMGGQACVFYGAAEFSRDTNVALLASSDNLDRLAGAMRELKAEIVAVPTLGLDHLKRGHAVHFRCRHPEADGMRLDVMSVMRGLPEFSALWERRTTAQFGDVTVEIMALPDLVQAKKTQRDKDWPMIRRLVEANWFQFRDEPNEERVAFWLAEARTPGLLREIASEFPQAVEKAAGKRGVLRSIATATDDQLSEALAEEERRERAADREYWKPLRKELEQFRHDLLP